MMIYEENADQLAVIVVREQFEISTVFSIGDVIIRSLLAPGLLSRDIFRGQSDVLM